MEVGGGQGQGWDLQGCRRLGLGLGLSVRSRVKVRVTCAYMGASPERPSASPAPDCAPSPPTCPPWPPPTSTGCLVPAGGRSEAGMGCNSAVGVAQAISFSVVRPYLLAAKTIIFFRSALHIPPMGLTSALLQSYLVMYPLRLSSTLALVRVR